MEYCRMIWDERIENNLRKREAYVLGKSEGKDEGIEQKQTEMIMNMYKDGLELKQISKYANIPIEKVEEIIKNNFDNNKGTN